MEPYRSEPHKIDAGHFRSIFRATVIYCTLCRFDEFSRLKDSNFVDMGTYVQVFSRDVKTTSSVTIPEK